ncbi:MAG TPA: SCO family protein [Croceicoccus sp.]|nr:SCO family protein [Croceicoccus sp.]
MNRPAMPNPRFTASLRLPRPALPLIAAAMLGACGPQPAAQPELATAPLAGATIGGDFTLTGKDGKPVNWSDFAGQWRIVYFGYTFCPDVCPVDAAAIGQGLAQFEKAQPALGAKVTPIFITVDPERDTPAVVGEFAANFHPRMVGLTGTPDAIAATARKFAVWSEKGEAAAGGGYLVNHTNQTVLFTPDGAPVALLPTDKGGKAVADEIARWVR